MPITLYGQTYYKPVEACRAAGVSRGTFMRWIYYGTLPYTEKSQVSARLDMKDHRMFREQGLVSTHRIDQLKSDVKKVKRNLFLRNGKRIDIL
jgi:predicted site-specific integrase-resolvase